MTVTWMNGAQMDNAVPQTRRLESPTPSWPGYVLIYDPIPLAKTAMLEHVMLSIPRDQIHTAHSQGLLLPAVLPCIAEWHIDGFPDPVTAENFPGTPRINSSVFISKLISEVVRIFTGGSHADS